MKRRPLGLALLSIGLISFSFAAPSTPSATTGDPSLAKAPSSASAPTQTSQNLSAPESKKKSAVPSEEAQKTASSEEESQAPQLVPASAVNSEPPLNKLGAVDVNANVPYEVQVPAADTPPEVLTTAASTWSTRVPPAPVLKAKSAILVEVNSGQILAESLASERLPPASITKLMLIYVLDQALAKKEVTLDQVFMVPTIAWATGGSRMFLKPGDKVKLRDLISGIIVDSGNDAAVTVAVNVAGTQEAFVALMNEQALRLGMKNTHFSDVMGLPAPNHYTTARDLAILASHLLSDYPEYKAWFAQKTFTYNKITQENYNKLLFIYPYAIGLKTGSTNTAGYSLVSAAQKPDNPMELVGVVLGAGSRDHSATESKALLEYGFRNFETVKLYEAHQSVTDASIQKGVQKTIPVGVASDLYVTLPVQSQKDLKAQATLNPNLTAPIHAGQILGTLTLSLDGKIASTTPLIALQADGVQSAWQAVGRTVAGWF